MSDLTVLTVVENDIGLVDLMISSVRKFTDPEPYILICENGSKNSALDKYRSDPMIRIIPNSPKLTGGSNRHGSGINKLLPEIKTKRAAIVESDCIIVDSGWDKLTTKVAASKKGTQANFPFYYAAFMVFDTNAVKQVDFRPGTDKSRSSGKSYQPHEDVAWQLGKYVKPEDVELVDCIDCKTGECQILDSRFQCEEYWRDGGVVAVHFGRGSNIRGKANRKGFSSHQVQLAEFKDVMHQLVEM